LSKNQQRLKSKNVLAATLEQLTERKPKLDATKTLSELSAKPNLLVVWNQLTEELERDVAFGFLHAQLKQEKKRNASLILKDVVLKDLSKNQVALGKSSQKEEKQQSNKKSVAMRIHVKENKRPLKQNNLNVSWKRKMESLETDVVVGLLLAVSKITKRENASRRMQVADTPVKDSLKANATIKLKAELQENPLKEDTAASMENVSRLLIKSLTKNKLNAQWEDFMELWKKDVALGLLLVTSARERNQNVSNIQQNVTGMLKRRESSLDANIALFQEMEIQSRKLKPVAQHQNVPEPMIQLLTQRNQNAFQKDLEKDVVIGLLLANLMAWRNWTVSIIHKNVTTLPKDVNSLLLQKHVKELSKLHVEIVKLTLLIKSSITNFPNARNKENQEDVANGQSLALTKQERKSDVSTIQKNAKQSLEIQLNVCSELKFTRTLLRNKNIVAMERDAENPMNPSWFKRNTDASWNHLTTKERPDVVHGKQLAELKTEQENVSTITKNANGNKTALDANTELFQFTETNPQNVSTVVPRMTAFQNKRQLSMKRKLNVPRNYTTINSETDVVNGKEVAHLKRTSKQNVSIILKNASGVENQSKLNIHSNAHGNKEKKLFTLQQNTEFVVVEKLAQKMDQRLSSELSLIVQWKTKKNTVVHTETNAITKMMQENQFVVLKSLNQNVLKKLLKNLDATGLWLTRKET
jgi:hypothetical protein